METWEEKEQMETGEKDGHSRNTQWEREGEGITGRTRCTVKKKKRKKIQFKLINFIYSTHNSGDCLQAALQSGRTKGPSEQPSKEMHLDWHENTSWQGPLERKMERIDQRDTEGQTPGKIHLTGLC